MDWVESRVFFTSNPPPKQEPAMAATTGFGQSSSFWIID